MRFLFFIALAVFIIWIWPMIFQKPVGEIPAASSLGRLTDVEQQYYKQVFDYTMEAINPGANYSWQTAGGNGTIYVSAPFKSKSNAVCRNYTEQFTIGGTTGTSDGVACKREGRAGWCRLKKTDALTCAMEPPGNIFEETVRGTQGVIETGKDMLGKAHDMVR